MVNQMLNIVCDVLSSIYSKLANFRFIISLLTLGST